MRKQEKNKIIKAFCRILDKESHKECDISFGESYGIRISEDDYKILEPFFGAFITTNIRVGKFECNISGSINCGVIIEGNSVLVDFHDERNYMRFILSMQTYFEYFNAVLYKKINWEELYLNNGITK